jgi:hypothetical protein
VHDAWVRRWSRSPTKRQTRQTNKKIQVFETLSTANQTFRLSSKFWCNEERSQKQKPQRRSKEELQMDYFRAGGASTETEEQERRRKRDEALAWAKKRREQRKQKEAAAAAAEDPDAEGGAAPQSQGWGMDTLNPWGSKRKGPLPTKASLRSNEPQPKLFGFIPTSAPRTAPSHHICHHPSKDRYGHH